MSNLAPELLKNRQANGTRALWLRWIKANAIAELVGLGLTAFLSVLAFSYWENIHPLWIALLMIIAGALLEGLFVGYIQWQVLRDYLTGLSLKTWATATAVGAGVAWGLGMIPSTFFSLAESSEPSQPMPEPSPWLILLLAASMGLLLGPILGIPQWWVLRRHVGRAGWWIVANALAWMVGMVVVFAASGKLAVDSSYLLILLSIAGSLLVAGALVGAIHGLFLVWLLDQQKLNRRLVATK